MPVRIKNASPARRVVLVPGVFGRSWGIEAGRGPSEDRHVSMAHMIGGSLPRSWGGRSGSSQRKAGPRLRRRRKNIHPGPDLGR